MTDQEIFNTVWHAMKAQGEQSVTKHGDCRYRGPDGLKCAVGCVLTDEEYNSDMDDEAGVSVEFLIKQEIFPARLIPHADLLFDLQRCHDGADRDFWEQFSDCASDVAKNHGLSVPEESQ